MALSEMFDNGSAHPWVDLKVDNVVTDNTLTQSTNSKISIYTLTTTGVVAVPYLVIPVTVLNGAYQINIKAVGYNTSVGSVGFGTVSIVSQSISYVAGAIAYISPADVNNSNQGRFGYGLAGTIGAVIVAAPTTITLQVINTLAGNNMKWVINTEIIGPVF